MLLFVLLTDKLCLARGRSPGGHSRNDGADLSQALFLQRHPRAEVVVVPILQRRKPRLGELSLFPH